eukprot:scaffold964_cov261-Pinguiococcus_pyrenoidosus.AAC.13
MESGQLLCDRSDHVEAANHTPASACHPRRNRTIPKSPLRSADWMRSPDLEAQRIPILFWVLSFWLSARGRRSVERYRQCLSLSRAQREDGKRAGGGGDGPGDRSRRYARLRAAVPQRNEAEGSFFLRCCGRGGTSGESGRGHRPRPGGEHRRERWQPQARWHGRLSRKTALSRADPFEFRVLHSVAASVELPPLLLTDGCDLCTDSFVHRLSNA